MQEKVEDYERIRQELLELADRVQNGELTSNAKNDDFKKTIESLQRYYDILSEDKRESEAIIASVDREQAIQVEKNTNIFYQLGQLEKRITELERNKDVSSEKTKDMIEKIMMLVIGGLVTYVFSLVT